MIDYLKKQEENELDDWYESSSKEQSKVLRAIAKYATDHPDKLMAYCTSLTPNELSSLSIVYESLSTYSSQFDDFLYSEIKRVVKLRKQNQIEAEVLEVLEDIELERIYEVNYPLYKNIIEFLIEALKTEESKENKLAILSVLDYYLIEADEDNGDYSLWEETLSKATENDSQKIQNVVKDIFYSEEAQHQNNGKKSTLFTVLFFAGLVAQLAAIYVYDKTIIDWKICIGTYITCGLIGFLIFKTSISKYVKNVFYAIFFSLCVFGGITIFLFLFSNMVFASPEHIQTKHEIIRKSSLPGSKGHRSERKPTVYFMYQNEEKELVFPYSKTIEVDKANYIGISVAKGMWGFDVIKEKSLLVE